MILEIRMWERSLVREKMQQTSKDWRFVTWNWRSKAKENLKLIEYSIEGI